MSFDRILRSSALMGGAQVVILLSAFVRTKVIALTLGAAGVGLVGIFNAFSGNISSLAGWGLGTSGVRLVSGADEADRPAKAAALRRMGWMLSLIGLAVALMTFWPVGLATFESDRYVVEMAIVALSVPCVIASSAWSAVLQASGKIRSLAKVQITGALAGLLLGLPAIYVWGKIGIAIGIFLAAAVPAFALWRASKSEFLAVPPASPESSDLRLLISLGGGLMLVGWFGQLSAYTVRLAIIRHEGISGAGYYQAAHAIAGSLPGFIFSSMGADFFPRIAKAENETEAGLITEKQIQAALLLGMPLVVALVALGKLAVRLLYSETFDAALPLVSWMAWGVFFRLIAWPMGFWLLARRSIRIVVATEALAAFIGAILPVIFLQSYGLEAAGASFAASCFIYAVTLVATLKHTTGFSFSAKTYLWVSISFAALAAAQLWTTYSPGLYAGIIPVSIVTIVCGATYWYELKST